MNASASDIYGLRAALRVSKEQGLWGCLGSRPPTVEVHTAWPRDPEGDRLMGREERPAGSSERKGLWAFFPSLWGTPDNDGQVCREKLAVSPLLFNKEKHLLYARS